MMTKGLGATQRSPRLILKLLQMLLEAVGPRGLDKSRARAHYCAAVCQCASVRGGVEKLLTCGTRQSGGAGGCPGSAPRGLSEVGNAFILR